MLTEAEAAAILGVSARTLRTWRCRPPKSGAPPYYRHGRVIRYDRVEIEKWKSERRVA